MGDTPQNAGEGNEPASPFEQTQRILNNIIEQIRGLEWSECLAKLDKKNETGKVKIIGNGIKTEHAEEREAADREQIEAIEDVKAAERLQRNCEYVRGLCKLTIKRKRDSPEAIEAAKKVLELLHKIERGDHSLWRELGDATYILLSELEANRGPSAKGRHPQPKTRKVPAEPEQKALTLLQRIWILIKKIPRWIYALAALLTVLHLLGWLQPIKDFISKILWPK